jgi:hypothetical protein
MSLCVTAGGNSIGPGCDLTAALLLEVFLPDIRFVDLDGRQRSSSAVTLISLS